MSHSLARRANYFWHWSSRCADGVENTPNLRIGLLDRRHWRAGRNLGCRRVWSLKGRTRHVADRAHRSNVEARPSLRRQSEHTHPRSRLVLRRQVAYAWSDLIGCQMHGLGLPSGAVGRHVAANAPPSPEGRIPAGLLPMLIKQTERRNDLQHRSPQNASRAQFDQQIVVVRAHPTVQTSVRIARLREQNVDVFFPRHSRFTDDDGSNHISEKKATERRCEEGGEALGSGTQFRSGSGIRPRHPWCADC